MQISRIIFLYAINLTGTLTPNRRQFHVKLKFILNQSLIFVLLKTFSNHFNATNTKNTFIVGVNNTTAYKFFDSCEKTASRFVTSL